MRKYFLLAAISAALFLTACGNNQVDTAETSEATFLQSLETTYDSDVEITVPAFEPEWDDVVTSLGFVPDHKEIIETSAEGEAEIVVAYTSVNESLNTEAEGTEPFPQVSENGIPNLELSENEYVAYITEAYENKNGGYSLVVEMYDVMGYGSPVLISLYSENEFTVGEWVKVEFAPETCFMESYPLQVRRDDVLKIELIDN